MSNLTNEKPCLVQAKQGFSVSYKNKFLYSKYNPQATIEKLISELTIPEGTLVIVNSPVLFYGINLLINKLSENSFILAIEHDKNLYDFSIECAESNFNKVQNEISNFIYLNLQTQNDILSLFNNKNFTNKIRCCKRAIKINLSAIINEYENFYQNIFSYFTNYISQFWKNRITLTKLGKLYSKNIFLNLPKISNSKNIIFNSIEKPIIVFGAGTSLDKTMKDFESAKISLNDFFIICVDSALKPLLNYEINPDIVVAVESQLANEKAFIGTKNIPYLLISDLTSRPNINNYHKKNISFIFTEYCNANFLDTILKLNLPIKKFIPLGSVGLYAIQLAINLRKSHSPIFFTGLDFAFTLDNTHCKDASASFTKKINSNRINSSINVLPAYKIGTTKFNLNEKNIFTDKALLNYANQFIELFYDAKNFYNISDVSIFNCLELNSHKIQTIKPNEIINKLENKNIDKHFDNKNFYQSVENNLDIKNYLLNEIDSLNKLKENLSTGNESIEKIKEQIDLHDYLFLHFPDGNNEAKTDTSFLKRVRNEIDFFLKILNRSLNQFEK